jgi:WD40 repeat protein
VLGVGRLIPGSFDNTSRLWDPASGTCERVFEEPQNWVRVLAVLGNGRLASGSADNNIIRLWDPARPDGAPQVLLVADAAITALVAHTTRPLLVAGDTSGRLHWLQLPPGSPYISPLRLGGADVMAFIDPKEDQTEGREMSLLRDCQASGSIPALR